MKKTALITGASSGIGKELAHIHAQKGGDLIVIARSENKLIALKKELESKYAIHVTVLTKDLTEPEAPQEIYEYVKTAGLQVDYLINNAGFGGLGKFHQRKLKDDLSMIAVNITALTSLTHYFLQDFVKRNEGKILNVSSSAALTPGPLQAVYYASKAYVTSFSNALAEELYATNITVTTLMPGATESKFGEVSGMDKTAVFVNLASAQKVAEDGYNGMMEGKLDVITGLSPIQKLLTKLIPLTPKKILLPQIRKMQEVS
ncbi:short-chain dehydrogenase [Neptunitalea sp. Y10]|uniref:Short-chain dehydrogenase n=2 Tax=Neptunitalea lumnitzerae TaxID=2965509 RepID=A0ABQ5MJ61_9FLAO|nr:short-chain dehydrogenase [Neptunitalea sp. Y10]